MRLANTAIRRLDANWHWRSSRLSKTSLEKWLLESARLVTWKDVTDLCRYERTVGRLRATSLTKSVCGAEFSTDATVSNSTPERGDKATGRDCETYF